MWPDHVETVAAFLAAASQWRTCPLPTERGWRIRYTGLDYCGAKAGIEAAGIALTPELWTGVRVMEEAARDALNEEW